MTLSLATVALSFIPGSTHPCHGSSLAYAGLLRTNEHLREHEILTSALLSPNRDEIADEVIIAQPR